MVEGIKSFSGVSALNLLPSLPLWMTDMGDQLMTQRGTRGEPPITINPFDCLLITKLQVDEEPGTGGGGRTARDPFYFHRKTIKQRGFPSTRNAEGTTGFLGENFVTLYSRLGFFLFRRSTNWRGDSSSKSICPPQNENIWPVSSTSVQPR